VKLFHKHEWSEWRKYEKTTSITLFNSATALIENRRSRHCFKCGEEEDESQ
jgi:hypothetical protein